MKHWENKAFALLDASLNPIPQELNELDWKENISPNNKKLSKHLCGFANHAGGGFLVFGIDDKDGTIVGIDQNSIEKVLNSLSSLARDTLEPVIRIDHMVTNYQGKVILIIYIPESKVKPVYIKSGNMMNNTHIRTGGSTREASRQEIGALMLYSKTPVFEELYASSVISKNELFILLEYQHVFELLKKPIPQSLDEIVNFLIQ